jgi:hypothetical protein
MNVIRRPIKRVDDPCQLFSFDANRCGGLFLADECVIRETSSNDVSNGVLRRQIGVGDEIGGRFFSSIESSQEQSQFSPTGASRRLARL